MGCGLLIVLLILGSGTLSRGLPTSSRQVYSERLTWQVVGSDSHVLQSEKEDDHSLSNSCAIVGDDVRQVFDELTEELDITEPNGSVCAHHMLSQSFGISPQISSNLTCNELYFLISQVLLRLNVTDECCLVNGTGCHNHNHGGSTASVAEVYGYGFLMILVVSSCSLLGVAVIPLLKKNSRFGQLYKYIYALMIAMGASALFCDAVLHLIPETFGLHGHSHSEEEGEDQTFLWKGVVLIVGTYFFFIFETILHTWNAHDHSHGADIKEQEPQPTTSEDTTSSPLSSSDRTPLTGGASGTSYGSTSDRRVSKAGVSHGQDEQGECSEHCVEPTMPHGQCRDSDELTVGIVHPRSTARNVSGYEDLPSRMNCFARTWHYLLNVKPLAWLIIFGDAIHNFADGLALGAAIAQSLSLGLSTMIALTFHEIPHELGDYVILLSTGMQWYIALLFNLLSQLTGFVGFFIGVAISTHSEEANGWLLAIAAGVFIYIALVDLLPGLIHTKDKGCSRWGQFLMSNLGFFISFAALLILALFEEKLNKAIDTSTRV